MILLLGLAMLNVALIVAPLLAALPPVNQTPAILAAARAAMVLAPFTSAALAVVLAIRLWRRWTWTGLALFAATLGCVALSRVNILEMVFGAAREAEIAGIGQFHDIRDDDMVIGVAIDGRSRAYPVRYLAYHHMLNDQLGATALLPTY